MFFFLPYGNDRRTRRFPAVTYALIAVNILVFCCQYPAIDGTVKELGLYPGHPTLGSIFTSMFAHGSISHLLWNMLFLWLFGPNVEDALGRLEYGIFYAGSGLAAALLHIVIVRQFMPSTAEIPMVGASGAIAGILGIFAVRFYKTRIKIWYVIFFLFIKWGKFTISAMVGLGIWFAQQLWGGIASINHPQGEGIAYWSHIGGMIFGIILAYAMSMVMEGSKEYLMDDAQTSMQRGETMAAAGNLMAFIEKEPGNPDAHANLARTFAMEKNTDLAAKHYINGIELLLRQGRMENASALYQELMHENPSARPGIVTELRIARHIADKGDFNGALPILERITREHPGTPESEVALMKLGEICLGPCANPGMAASCFERLLKDFPFSSYRPMVEKRLAEARSRMNTTR